MSSKSMFRDEPMLSERLEILVLDGQICCKDWAPKFSTVIGTCKTLLEMIAAITPAQVKHLCKWKLPPTPEQHWYNLMQRAKRLEWEFVRLQDALMAVDHPCVALEDRIP